MLAALILVAAVANLNRAVANVALLDMGVRPLGDLHLEDLGQACAAAGRWEFLFTAAPLRIVGGTRSPSTQTGGPDHSSTRSAASHAAVAASVSTTPRRSASAARVPASCVASGPPQ